MSERERGKRGTIKMDPTATIPEAAPPLRFVAGADALAEADRADVGAGPPAKPRTPASDRKEFVKAEVSVARARTLELRKIDVSRADPRQAPTVKGRGVTFSPGLGAAEAGEPAERSRAGAFLYVAAVLAGVLLAAFGWLLVSHYVAR
jgi:hypothetical protein